MSSGRAGSIRSVRPLAARAPSADSTPSTIVVFPVPFSPWNTVQSGCGCSFSSSIGPRFQMTMSVTWWGCRFGASRSTVVLLVPARAYQQLQGSSSTGAAPPAPSARSFSDCPANIVQPVSFSSAVYSSNSSGRCLRPFARSEAQPKDAEDARQPLVAGLVGPEGLLPGPPDLLEHLLGGELVHRQPVVDGARPDAQRRVERERLEPLAMRALLGPQAHDVDPDRRSALLHVVADELVDRSALQIGCALPAARRGERRHLGPRSPPVADHLEEGLARAHHVERMLDGLPYVPLDALPLDLAEVRVDDHDPLVRYHPPHPRVHALRVLAAGVGHVEHRVLLEQLGQLSAVHRWLVS